MSGKKKAIIIGINDYDDKGFEKLKYAETDAKAIYDILLNPEIGEFAEEDIILLTGKTKTEVEKTLGKVLKGAGEDDLVFIYFAGHGKLDESSELCLAARDTEIDNLIATSIHIDMIKKMVVGSKCKHKVLVIDSCYSGAANRSFRGEGITAESLEQISKQISGGAKGTIVISASRALEKAEEREELGYGVFTYNLVKGLKGGEADIDGDGYISLDELYGYVYDKVKAETNDQQVPGKWGEVEDKIFIAKNIKTLEKKREEIESLYKSARDLMGKRKLKEALNNWNKIHELDPSNAEVLQQVQEIAEAEERMIKLTGYCNNYILTEKAELLREIYDKAFTIFGIPLSILDERQKRYYILVENLLSEKFSLETVVGTWKGFEDLEQNRKAQSDASSAIRDEQLATGVQGKTNIETKQKEEDRAQAGKDRLQLEDKGIKETANQAGSVKKEDAKEGTQTPAPNTPLTGGATTPGQTPGLKEKQDTNEPVCIRVFISYTHDSPEHKGRVLEISERLRSDGVDCHIDQYEDSPPEGWARWMDKQIEESNFVLIVCTEKYERRFKGKEEAGKGLGAKWEGAIITQELYEAEANNTKFIPVLFSRDDSVHIPVVLSSATYYWLSNDEEYELLYRRLTNQPRIRKRPLGKVKKLVDD